MTGLSAKELEDKFTLEAYPKLDFALVRGEGSHVYDQSGRRYLEAR